MCRNANRSPARLIEIANDGVEGLGEPIELLIGPLSQILTKKARAPATSPEIYQAPWPTEELLCVFDFTCQPWGLSIAIFVHLWRVGRLLSTLGSRRLSRIFWSSVVLSQNAAHSILPGSSSQRLLSSDMLTKQPLYLLHCLPQLVWQVQFVPEPGSFGSSEVVLSLGAIV
jgi:hypothetical protein